eukprot:620597-Prorocentrum_minimum.AAC.7
MFLLLGLSFPAQVMTIDISEGRSEQLHLRAGDSATVYQLTVQQLTVCDISHIVGVELASNAVRQRAAPCPIVLDCPTSGLIGHGGPQIMLPILSFLVFPEFRRQRRAIYVELSTLNNI